MTPALALRQARAHLAGGWSGPGELEPLCRDTEGRYCGPASEGVARFSVEGALQFACPDGEQRVELLRRLERIATPGWAAFEDFVRSQPGGVLPEYSEATFWRWLRASLLGRSCAAQPTFERWLMDPARTLREVLGVFDRAIRRAKSERST